MGIIRDITPYLADETEWQLCFVLSETFIPLKDTQNYIYIYSCVTRRKKIIANTSTRQAECKDNEKIGS